MLTRRELGCYKAGYFSGSYRKGISRTLGVTNLRLRSPLSLLNKSCKFCASMIAGRAASGCVCVCVCVWLLGSLSSKFVIFFLLGVHILFVCLRFMACFDSKGLVFWVMLSRKGGGAACRWWREHSSRSPSFWKKRCALWSDRGEERDVSCRGDVLQAYVVPCLHNTGAHALGKESHDLFHVKDRAETWESQYPDSLEYPMLSDFAIYERYVTQSLLPPLPHLLICWVWMLVDSLMEHNTNPHWNFYTRTRTHSLVHTRTHSLVLTRTHSLVHISFDICHCRYGNPGAPRRWEDTWLAWRWPTPRSTAVRNQGALHAVCWDARLTTSRGFPRLETKQIVLDMDTHNKHTQSNTRKHTCLVLLELYSFRLWSLSLRQTLASQVGSLSALPWHINMVNKLFDNFDRTRAREREIEQERKNVKV